MKKLVILSGCLWALGASPVRAQTGAPAVAVVTSWGTGLTAVHLLIDRDGKMEQVDYTGTNSAKGAESQAEALRQVVAKLYQEGYTLKAAPTATVLIFVKEH